MAELYQQIGRPEVYVKESGTLRHIANPEAFKAGGYKWDDVVQLPAAAFKNLTAKLKIGEPLSAEELAKTSTTPDITLPEKSLYDMATIDKIRTLLESQQKTATSAEKQAQQIEPKLQEAEKEQAGIREKIKTAIFGAPKQADIIKEQYQKFDIPGQLKKQQDLLTEIGSLNESLNKLNEEERAALDANEQRLTDMGQINRDKAVIQQKFDRRRQALAAELNAKAALLQAQRGLLADARSFAQEAVNAALYDQQQKVKGLEYLYENNKDWIDSLDKAQQNAIKQVIDFQKQQLDEARQEKMQVMDLMLKYPNAGITPSMSLDEAVEAVKAQPATAEYQFKTIGKQLYRVNPATGQAELVASAEGLSGEPKAVVQNTNTGKAYDLGTTQGIKTFVEDHPEFNDYATMNAYLDQNFKGMDATTRKQLLQSAGVKQKVSPKYGVSFWAEAAREALKRNYRMSPSDFLLKIKKNFKDANEGDLEVARKAFENEKSAIPSGWLARRIYFKQQP